MARQAKLTREQIEAVCRELLATRRHVTLRATMAVLEERFGATGRRARVCKILGEMAANVPLAASADLSLIERLERAEKRAALAEEREERNQEAIARRLDERLKDLENRYRAELESLRRRPSAEQYLRVHQELAEVRRRLEEAEFVREAQ